MRLTTTFLFSALAACALPVVAAVHYPRSGSLAKRGSHNVSPPQAIALRQHHVQRDLIDLCISVDAKALSPILQIIDPLAANLHLCLCLQDLDIFLDSDVGVLLGNLLGGKNNLAAAIKLLINTSPHHQQCTFPPHSHHTCVVGHPCAFECDPPYVQSGKTCICPKPLMECNGKCGSFPTGCGSAVPHHPKQRRSIGPITTFAQAQASCKSGETVCGIAGREEKIDFECIDTRVTLDSCGGCVTPHRFTDGTSLSVKGTECGRLPGVVTASCSNSRCVITQCREGWHLDANRSECVSISAGPLYHGPSSRMKKARRRGILGNTNVVLDSELAAKFQAYVGFVIDLTTTSGSVHHPSSTPPTPVSQPSINHTELVGAVVSVTANLINSRTVVELVGNINTVVKVNAIVYEAFGSCGCVGALGLRSLVEQLVVVVNVGLDIQRWCGNHPVAVPSPHPSEPSTGLTPIPNTSNAPINVNLDATLNTLILAAARSQVNIVGAGIGLDSIVSGLRLGSTNLGLGSLNTLTVNGFVAMDSQLLAKMKVLVNLVAIVNSGASPPANIPPIVGSTPIPSPTTVTPTLSPVALNLVATITEAIVELLSSRTVAAFVANVDALVEVNTRAADVLSTCACVGGLDGLVESLEAVANVALEIKEWCIHHPVGMPVPHPSSTPVPHPSTSAVPHPSPLPSGVPKPPTVPNTSNNDVIIGLDDLLHGLLKADIIVKGVVGGGLASTTNTLLNGLGIGPANVTPRGGLLTTDTNADVQVDATLLIQFEAVVKLVTSVKNGSSCLPAAPANSPPVVGTVPVDMNLIDGIVQTTVNLLSSDSVSVLLLNLDTSVEVIALVNSTLVGYNGVADLGLSALARDVENLLVAVLSVQSWCAHHPVVVPTNPPTPSSSLPAHGPISTAPGPAPTPSQGPRPPTVDTHINLGLDDLLASLGVGLTSSAYAIVDLNNMLNTVINVVVHIQGHSPSLPPPPHAPPATTIAPHTSAPGPHPHPSATPVPHTPAPSINQGLIAAIVQATANLVKSSFTDVELLANVNVLLSASGSLADALDGCGCVGHMGLQPLVKDVDELLDALLSIHVWCQHHSGVGVPSIPGGNGSGPASPSSIIADPEKLLALLDLDDVVQIHGTVVGLGEEVTGITNSVLDSVGLGGVRRWLAGR